MTDVFNVVVVVVGSVAWGEISTVLCVVLRSDLEWIFFVGGHVWIVEEVRTGLVS